MRPIVAQLEFPTRCDVDLRKGRDSRIVLREGLYLETEKTVIHV
jgi:hypothetical protein